MLVNTTPVQNARTCWKAFPLQPHAYRVLRVGFCVGYMPRNTVSAVVSPNEGARTSPGSAQGWNRWVSRLFAHSLSFGSYARFAESASETIDGLFAVGFFYLHANSACRDLSAYYVPGLIVAWRNDHEHAKWQDSKAYRFLGFRVPGGEARSEERQ